MFVMFVFSANLGNLFHDGTMWEEQKGDADSYIAHIGLQKKVDMTLSNHYHITYDFESMANIMNTN